MGFMYMCAFLQHHDISSIYWIYKLPTFMVEEAQTCSVGNVYFSYLAILASCFKIVLAKLELHLPSLASG
jgi:hypothetical protein